MIVAVALAVLFVPSEMETVEIAVMFTLRENVVVTLVVLIGAIVMVAFELAVLLLSRPGGRVTVASVSLSGGTGTVVVTPAVIFEVIDMLAVSVAVPSDIRGLESVVKGGVSPYSGSSAVTCIVNCSSRQIPFAPVVNQLTVSVVYSASAISVIVVMIVDGVTRQLQTLLKRREGYVEASPGGTGIPCLFRSGETTDVVALGKLLW